jgi:hypothetical protein
VDFEFIEIQAIVASFISDRILVDSFTYKHVKVKLRALENEMCCGVIAKAA